ncbi:MAG: hypothetical protein ABIP55_05385, partial [Tepidisphaeraceae bacterium]
MFVDGKWMFLKIGKPLLNYADEREVDWFIAQLPVLRQKNYRVIEINCYWHDFDHRGDGTNLSTGPLTKMINAVAEQGMFP